MRGESCAALEVLIPLSLIGNGLRQRNHEAAQVTRGKANEEKLSRGGQLFIFPTVLRLFKDLIHLLFIFGWLKHVGVEVDKFR